MTGYFSCKHMKFIYKFSFTYFIFQALNRAEMLSSSEVVSENKIVRYEVKLLPKVKAHSLSFTDSAYHTQSLDTSK